MYFLFQQYYIIPFAIVANVKKRQRFAGCYSESTAGLIRANHAMFRTSNDLPDLFPRILFVHGSNDSTVSVQKSVDMYNMLGDALPPQRRQDVDVRMRLYKNLTHEQCLQGLFKDIEEFVGDAL